MSIYDAVGVKGRSLDPPDVFEPEDLEPLRDTRLFFQPEMARLELAQLEQEWQEICKEYNALGKAVQNCQERLSRTQDRQRLIEALLRQYGLEVDPFEPMPSQSFEEALAESEKYGLPDVTALEALEMHQEHD